MGDLVIAAYKPKPGMDVELLELIKDHVPHLRRLGLATELPSCTMMGQDGVIIEVFEWSVGAVATAHEHPEVLKMWDEYAKVCDYVPLASLPESSNLFAMFKPIEM